MSFGEGKAAMKEASALVNDLCALRAKLSKHELLTGPLDAELNELLNRLSDLLCPYSVEQLDRKVKELDEKFPDWEHGYVRCGTTVTWLDWPRSPEHPLWDVYHARAPQPRRQDQ